MEKVENLFFKVPSASVKEREEEIRRILSFQLEDEAVLSAEDVRERWSTFLEATLPKCPWPAFSNSEKTVVDIVDVDWCTLNCKAVILEQGDGELKVPLADLHLLNLPEYDCKSVSKAVLALDNLRFFLQNLWFPWDEDDDGDEGGHWVDEHLSYRFLAYENSLNKEDDAFLVLKRLSREYVELNGKLKGLQNEEEDESQLVMIHQLQDGLEKLRKNAAIVENPVWRSAFREEHTKDKILRRRRTNGNVIFFVWKCGNYYQLQTFLDSARDKTPYDEEDVEFKPTLQDAIDDSLPGDVIIVQAGHHLLTDIGDLKENIVIYGVDKPEDTVLQVGETLHQYGLEVSRNAVLENLTLCPNVPDKEENFGGILVRKHAHVYLRQCHITGFKTGIKVEDDGKLSLRRSEISECEESIWLGKEVTMEATDVKIVDNKVGLLVDSTSFNNSVKLVRVDIIECDRNVLLIGNDEETKSEQESSEIVNCQLGDIQTIKSYQL